MLDENLLFNAYDLHIHAAPSPFDRILDDYGLLEAADQAGMAGILLKSHYESTAIRAKLINEHLQTRAKAYGAIVLNWPSGGLNPYAVYNALKNGAKIVYMPTRDSENSLKFGHMLGDFFNRPGIQILDETGNLKVEVFEIMEAVKSYRAVLATGHLSPKESVFLCTKGIRFGVRMALTHPEFSRTKIPVGIQQKLAKQGVYIEKCWYNIAEHECSALEMVAHIKKIGVERCFMTTDRGQANRESPVEAMRRFITVLCKNGINEKEINTMTCMVPSQILDG